MAIVSTFTLTSGATSVVLNRIFRPSVVPERVRNFSMDRLASGSIVYDVYGSPKKRWTIDIDVPLTSGEKTSLNTIFAVNGPITLVENFLESSVSYTVFFESIRETIEAYMGDLHYSIVLQEL